MKKISIVSFIGVFALFSQAFANQVEIVNISASNKPMQIEYKIGHKIGNSIVLSSQQSATVSQQLSIPVDLGIYERAGIVVTSVNGMELPPQLQKFAEPRTCSIATTAANQFATMKIFFEKNKNGHGKISCSHNNI